MDPDGKEYARQAVAEQHVLKLLEVLLQALTGAQLAAGQRVLVHAGSGGVGTMAIQMAKLWGAHVVTTCSAGKVSFVQVSSISHQYSHGTVVRCMLLAVLLKHLMEEMD